MSISARNEARIPREEAHPSQIANRRSFCGVIPLTLAELNCGNQSHVYASGCCGRQLAARRRNEMEHSRQTSAHAVTPQAAAPSIALAFENVSLAFDDHVVLRDVSFTVPKGSMRVVLGASGTGKSVMLKLILGLLRPDAGKITVNGQHIDD